MATVGTNITSLIISTKSEGIQASTKDLNELVKAADSAVKSTDKLKTSGKQQADSQKSANSALENALLAMKKQVDLLGASVSQTNSYNAALKGADAAQKAVAASLGKEVDAYKAKNAAQVIAIRENKALDASYAKLAQEAKAYYAAQAKAQSAGNNLNEVGQRTQAYQRLSAAQAEAIRMNNALNRAQNAGGNLNINGQRAEDYRKLASAQAEAIRMNNALNASIERQKRLLQQRDIDTHNESVRRYTQAQQEAIRMNREFDAQQRRLSDNTRRLTRDQHLNNNSLRDGQALVRGLTGGMGALWLSYGNVIGMFAGVAIAASLRQIVQLGSTIENTLEGIRVKGGESVVAIDAMRESIFDIGEGVFGPRKVAEAFEVLILAGLNAKEAMIGINDALNLSVVGGVSIEKAAFTLVQVATAIGLTASGFGMVGDTIAKTAAVSMSSVETLSEAFKSASVVSKMYKVSLNDIATSLAALSQLGIQGSAAGTSVRNYYKELAAQGDKIKKTFADLKMPEFSMRTATGGFKDLVTATTELHTAISKLTPLDQERAKANISNERGMKTLVETLDLVATKSTSSGNKLQELYDKIADHAGYTALGAIQMSLTTSKQLESVWNTLQTQSIKAFTAVDGEVNLLARRMKEVLQSKEFLAAITASATALISFVLFMAENTQTVVTFVSALAGFKILSGISLLISNIIPLLVSLGSFFTLGGTAAVGMAAAFPPLLAILAAAAAAWATYSWWKDKSLGNSGAEAAEATNNNISERLQQEIDLLVKKNNIYAQTGTNRGAEAQAERETAVEKFKSNEQTRIANALANTAAAKAQVTASVMKQYEVDGKVFSMSNNKALRDYIALKTTSDDLIIQSGKDVLKIESQVRKLKGEARTEESNQLKELADMQAAMPKGTGTLGEVPDVKAINDGYRTAQVSLDAEIKASKKAMQNFEDLQNDKFKAGEIGKLTFIRNVGEQQIAEYEKIAKDLTAKRMVAQGGTNKKADVARVDGFISANSEALEQAERKMASETNVELARLATENTRYQIKEYEAQGEFSKAAALRFSSEYSIAIQQVEKDFAKFGYAIPAVVNAMDSLREAKEAVMATADVREANAEFEKQNAIIVNLFKGVQTASEGQGMVAMYEAASAAAETYKEKLPALIEAQQKLAEKANISKAPDDIRLSEEALTKMKADAEHLKTMWSGVGESISKSLESAFGNGGKAVGDLLKAGTKFADLTDKTGSASIKTYGDMAGAAKGFFNENSTGYKVMEGAEKAFRLIELAGLAKSLYTSLFVTTAKATGVVAGQGVETSAVIAGEVVRNTAKVPGVFMSFMSALGPWGMAAAGVAIAAVLGAFSGGSSTVSGDAYSEKVANEGTGSVLGDNSAQSESIKNSLESLEGFAKPSLLFTSQMVGLLRSINTSLSGATNSLLQSGFDAFGSDFKGSSSSSGGGLIGSIFGSSSSSSSLSDLGLAFSRQTIAEAMQSMNLNKYTVTRTDSSSSGFLGFGSSSSTNYSTQFSGVDAKVSRQMSLATQQMYDLVAQAGKQIGSSQAQIEALKNLNTNLGKVTLKGLTGKEIEEKLSAVFSKMGDNMAKTLAPSIAGMQKAGEGFLETLVRVANGLSITNTWARIFGRSLLDTSIAGASAANQLADAFGGLENLNDQSKTFYESYYTQAEQAANSQLAVSEALASVNLAMPTTKDGFRDLANSLDLNTSAGRTAYATLLSLAPEFSDAAELIEKLATETSQKLIETFTGRGNLTPTLDATTLKFDALTVGMSNTGSTAGSISKIFLNAESDLLTFNSAGSAMTPVLSNAQMAALKLTGEIEDLKLSASGTIIDIEGLSKVLLGVNALPVGTSIAEANAYLSGVKALPVGVTIADVNAYLTGVKAVPVGTAISAANDYLAGVKALPVGTSIADANAYLSGVKALPVGVTITDVNKYLSGVEAIPVGTSITSVNAYLAGVKALPVSDSIAQVNAALSSINTETFVATLALVFDNLAEHISGVIGDIGTERIALREAAIQIINPTVMSKQKIQDGISSVNTVLPSNAGVTAALTAMNTAAAKQRAQDAALAAVHQKYAGLVDSNLQSYNASRSTSDSSLAAFKRILNGGMTFVGGMNGIQKWDNYAEKQENFSANQKFSARNYYSYGSTTAANNKTYSAYSQQFDAAKRALAVYEANSAAYVSSLANVSAQQAAATASTNAAAAAAKVAELAYASALQNFALDAGKSVSKLSKLREETVKYYDTQKQLADLMSSSAAGLRTTVENYRYSQMTEAEQFISLQASYATAYSMALSTDGETLAGYGSTLNSALNPLLEKAKEVLSGGEYATFASTAIARAEAIASRLETLTPTNYAADSLLMLGQIDATLSALDASSKSAERIIADAIGAGSDRTANGLMAVIAALSGQAVPAFATGGDHMGGLRLVGENGPELEATGPSRIFNASQTRSMLGGNKSDNSDVISELRALRQEVTLLRAEARATAVNSGKLVKQGDLIERDGMIVRTEDDTPLNVVVA